MALNMNTANKLTIFRIVLIPFFVILLIYHNITAALLIFGLASVTDATDGLIARRWNQKTRLGTFLDPMADKALLVTSFITLAVLHLLPTWLAVITISRDIIIVLGALIVYILTGNLNFSPTILGKMTTMVQILTVLVVLIGYHLQRVSSCLPAFVWLTAGITVASGFQYLYIGMEMLNETS
ncbi:MAG: CDP-diacylglycerol--glycerol-3-phosphate 3-phosphatidyltransferase [bacterium]